MTLAQFCGLWLPTISGTRLEDLMTVKVAYPFEWNCYESWNVVYRVRFHFGDVAARVAHGTGTPIDVMNGWQSKYHEDFCRIHHDAKTYFEERMGRPFNQFSDQTYAEMAAIIDAGSAVPPSNPPALRVVAPGEPAGE
jgi:hypothetical protein